MVYDSIVSDPGDHSVSISLHYEPVEGRRDKVFLGNAGTAHSDGALFASGSWGEGQKEFHS
jgi:hypothetical protein